MKKILYTAFYFCSALLLSSCIGDLDQYPHEDETSSTIYTSADNYKAVLGKIYAAMVTTGQEKGGDPDLSSNSGQDYMRCFFNLQECGTDEVASTWLSGDNVTGLTYLSWDANDPWVSDMYYRIYYNITLCNEFLRNATDESIARFTEQEQRMIKFGKWRKSQLSLRTGFPGSCLYLIGQAVSERGSLHQYTEIYRMYQCL